MEELTGQNDNENESGRKGGSESRRESDEMKARNSKIKGIKKNHSISGYLRRWCGAARRRLESPLYRLTPTRKKGNALQSTNFDLLSCPCPLPNPPQTL